ncbi:MAG: FtsX-like permease family protein, partial [Mycoplasmataceae bacterium]|nr:FtsX-like permease family protein [Mycoplasmataceae bacterium]
MNWILIVSLVLIAIFIILLTRVFLKNYSNSKTIIKAVFRDIKTNWISFTLLVTLFALIVAMISGALSGIDATTNATDELLISTYSPQLTISSKNVDKSTDNPYLGELMREIYNESDNNTSSTADKKIIDGTDYNSVNASEYYNADPILNPTSTTSTSYKNFAQGFSIFLSILEETQKEMLGTENDFIFNYLISATFKIDTTNSTIDNIKKEPSITLYRAPDLSHWNWDYSYDDSDIYVPFIGDLYEIDEIEKINDSTMLGINNNIYKDKVFISSASQAVNISDFSQDGKTLTLTNPNIYTIPPSVKGNTKNLEIVNKNIFSPYNISSAVSKYSNDTAFLGFVSYETFNELYKELINFYSDRDQISTMPGDWQTVFNWEINIGFKNDYVDLIKNNKSYKDTKDVVKNHSYFFSTLNPEYYSNHSNEGILDGIDDLSYYDYFGNFTTFTSGYLFSNFVTNSYTAMILVLFVIFLLIGVYVIGVIIRGIAKKNQKNIGMLQAFGFESGKIAFSYSLYPLLALFIGGTIGIGLSFLFASSWTSLLGIYTTIPATTGLYSLTNFFFAFILPILSFTYFSYLKIRKVMNQRTLDLIGESSVVPNKIVKKISKKSSKMKFDYSYALTNAVKSISKAIFIFATIFGTSFMMIISFMMISSTSSTLIPESFAI